MLGKAAEMEMADKVREKENAKGVCGNGETYNKEDGAGMDTEIGKSRQGGRGEANRKEAKKVAYTKGCIAT